jgi:hypothetical protein
MYLPGQLPYGPPSTNQGGVANLDGDLGPLLTSADPSSVSDPSGGPTNTQTTYLLPGAGNQIVNPSIATGNGIVQTPITSPGSRTRFQKLPASAADSCSQGSGLSGLGDGADPATCLSIQCGTLPQDVAGIDLIVACAADGYAGVKACTDPGCSCPPSPTPQSIIAAAPPASAPATPAGYVTGAAAPIAEPCGGYGASSALAMLASQAGRGMGACCQSGYQPYQTNTAAAPAPALGWWIVGGILLLMLTPSGSGRKR